MSGHRPPNQPGHRVRTGWVALVLFATGCTNTVVPPADPAQPTAAFLLDHGRHASIAIAHDDGVTRYAYGQWGYYAENRTGTLRASGTLFGRNAAGLGRRQLATDPELADVRHAVRVPIEQAWRIDVPGERAAALVTRLDGLFSTRADAPLDNPLYDLAFVRHPAPYNLSNNSNHMTGEWLRALGCRVDMGGPYSIWRVEDAATPR